MVILTKIAQFIGIRGAIAIALGVALVSCWWGWSNAAEARDKAKAELARAEAKIVLLEADAALKETAAVERQADTARIAEAEKELVDAIANIPDTRPGPVRVAAGCSQLRRAGYLDADLPPVCRPGGGGAASSNP